MESHKNINRMTYSILHFNLPFNDYLFYSDDSRHLDRNMSLLNKKSYVDLLLNVVLTTREILSNIVPLKNTNIPLLAI